jgi:hypothetical protein
MCIQVRYLVLISWGVCLSSCISPKFEKAWKRAESEQGTQRWAGEWKSDRRGSRGRIRAVSEVPREGQCSVFFEAGWHGFTTAYPVVLQAEQKGQKTLLSGQHDLKSCVGGGVYTYSGTMDGSVFFTRYSSKYDLGTFTLEAVPRR